MRLPGEAHQIQQTIETHLPHLSQPQSAGLVFWVSEAIPARIAGQNAVFSVLPLARVEQPAPVSLGGGSGS